jgi:hypothetical protein
MRDVMSMCMPSPLLEKLGGRHVSALKQMQRIAEVRAGRLVLRHGFGYTGPYGFFANHASRRGLLVDDEGEPVGWQWPGPSKFSQFADGCIESTARVESWCRGYLELSTRLNGVRLDFMFIYRHW